MFYWYEENTLIDINEKKEFNYNTSLNNYLTILLLMDFTSLLTPSCSLLYTFHLFNLYPRYILYCYNIFCSFNKMSSTFAVMNYLSIC